MTEFKVGDKVKVVGESASDDKHLIGMIGKIVRVRSDAELWDVDFGKKIEQRYNEVNDTTHMFREVELEIVSKARGVKLKDPTHMVVWDEEDRDPHKFFTNEPDAKKFIKELSDKNDVIKDSIILVEIKSAKKFVIMKHLRSKQFKI